MKKSTDEIVEFDPIRVRPMVGQPRKRFKGIQELADSITEVGQKSPGIVTVIEGGGKFDCQLIDGERRLRACHLAAVPFSAIVRPSGSDEENFVSSFAANFGKQDHDVIEIAEGLQRMFKAGKTVAQLARITGNTEPWVYQYLNFLKLDEQVRAMVVSEDDDAPRLPFQLAQMLVPLNAEDQLKLAVKITKGSGMKAPAARRMILKFRTSKGHNVIQRGGKCGGGKNLSILTIESLLETTSDRIGVYLDLPGPQFGEQVDAQDRPSVVRLIESIQDMAETLTGLAESIDSRLAKRQKQVA